MPFQLERKTQRDDKTQLMYNEYVRAQAHMQAQTQANRAEGVHPKEFFNNPFGNDLEAPCAGAYPAVAETLAALKEICAAEGAAGAKVQLSGSGPAVFAYIAGEEAAARVYERAKPAFRGMFLHLTKTL